MFDTILLIGVLIDTDSVDLITTLTTKPLI